MPRELEPWGGDLRPPRWLRRILRRAPDPGPSSEAMHESRKPKDPGVSVAENVDRAVFGGFSEGHPGNRPKGRG